MVTEQPTRVLYMEDDPGLARLVQKRLRREGFAVITAADGETGLQMVAENEFDIAILDHNMPGYSGLEVLDRLAELATAPPTIMLTGAGSEDTAVAAMKAGAAEYIVKDSNTNYLKVLPSIIERVITQHWLAEEKAAAERALRESEARYRTLFEQANDAILIENGDGGIINANDRACEMFGYNRAKLLDLGLEDLSHGDPEREAYAEARQAARNGDSLTYETTLRRANGDALPVEVSMSRLSDIQGDLCLSIVRDISERKEFEEKLRRMAHHDSLTGAFNRHYLSELMANEEKRALRYGHPIGFLMIDVNKFKHINDHHGHQTGDAVLKRIASFLGETIRVTDRLVRYGGDEFLIVLPETNGESDFVRDRILEHLSKLECFEPEFGFAVTLSIGVSHWCPESGEPLERALANADKTMYEDKRAAHS